MLQVSPDWSQKFNSPEEIENELSNENGEFEFKGEGLYLTNNDTVLIQKTTEGIKVGSHNENCSYKQFGDECDCDYYERSDMKTVYIVSVWNCPLEETILGKIIPTKVDNR